MDVSVRQGLHDTVYQVLDACITNPDERELLLKRRGIREAMTPRGAPQTAAPSNEALHTIIGEVKQMIESGDQTRMDDAYRLRRGPAFIDGVIDVVRRHTIAAGQPPPLVRTKTSVFS